MPISDQTREDIRLEEILRHEIRKELAAQKPVPTFVQRCSDFFDTKAGFWLLTTVLAGLVGTGYAALQRHLDRDEIAEREAIQRSQRDFDSVLKLGPMLTSDNRSQIDMAIVLLEGLAAQNALETRLFDQVRALMQSTLAAGLKPDAKPAERMQAEALLTRTDRARVAAIQQPEEAAAPAVAQMAAPPIIEAAVLPARVYIQIASEQDRDKAEIARTALRKAGLVAPGVEMVPAKSAPVANDFRYCQNKIDSPTLERVTAAVHAAVSPAPKVVILPARLCTSVRHNHYELWLARSQ
jgi:hypothetical protein